MLDGIFKYRGWSVSSEYNYRQADQSPITRGSDGQTSYVYVGSGWYAQAGYTFPRNINLAARYAQISPLKGIWSEIAPSQALTVGASKYIRGHRLKIQSDITYRTKVGQVNTKSANSELIPQNWMVQLQLEVGL